MPPGVIILLACKGQVGLAAGTSVDGIVPAFHVIICSDGLAVDPPASWLEEWVLDPLGFYVLN